MSVDEQPEPPCCADPENCPCQRREARELERQRSLMLERFDDLVLALEIISQSGPPTLSGHLHCIERARMVLREIKY